MASGTDSGGGPATTPAPVRWLVTGGCGFIGRALIGRLLAESGTRGVRVLDNLSVGTREDLAAVGDYREIPPGAESAGPVGLELVVGDVRAAGDCRRAASGCDAIVHLAASTGVPQSVEDPLADLEANVLGTFSMLMAARDVELRAFVFASSGAPLGGVDPPIHERLAPRPLSPYGASKLAGEGYCSAFCHAFGVPTVCLRFGNVYGPGSTHKSSVVAKFIRQAIAGEPCEIYGDGGQTRDFIYIDDLVDAILAAAARAPAGETFQIASGRERTVLEVAGLLRGELTKRGVAMELRHGPQRRGDAPRNYSDTSKAAEILDWRPRTSLEAGLATTVESFLAG